MLGCDTPLCITQMTHPQVLTSLLPGLVALVAPWRAMLEVDDHPPLDDPRVLAESIGEMIPHCWTLSTPQGDVVGAVSLTDVQPGQFAFIHGVRATAVRRHPAVATVARVALDHAFYTLNVKVVYARFEADNLGALGFCWQNGFQKLAYLPQAVRKNGLPQDQVLFGLFKPTYDNRLRDYPQKGSNHVIRT